MKHYFDETPNHRINNSYRWNMPEMPENVIGMGTADLDFYCAPCIQDRLTKIAQENCYNYRQHSREYYDAVQGWYRDHYHLDIRKDWLSNVPSTIGAVRMALEILAAAGDRVIVQSPVFRPISWAIEGADLQQIDNPMRPVNGHYEIDFADFEEKIRQHRPKVYLLVNPHNPTGRVYTRDELEKLVDICSRYNVKIVSDEVHCLILYGQNKHLPLFAVNEKAQEIGIQIVSLSKGYNIMSLPHAIITVANPELREKWNRQIRAYSFGYAVNSYSIAAVTSILEGEADEWMNDLTDYLQANLNELLTFFRECEIPLVPYTPEAGFLLWIDCKAAGLGTRSLDKVFLEQTGIHLDDGYDNFGPEGEGYIRINFAVTNATLKDAIQRIRKMFHV